MAAALSEKDFKIVKVLGSGAFGKVYQAEKTTGANAGSVFAIKKIKNSSRNETKNEIEVCNRNA